MIRRPSLIVRAVLRGLGLVAWLVPSRDREAWRREWEAEILHRWGALSRRPDATVSDQLRLARQASGSLSDAAWLRRQFTRDSDVVHDLRHAWRMVVSRPAPFLATAAILALGIGSTGAVLSLLDRLVVRALPYPDADRLVSIYQENTAAGVVREEVAPGNFLDWRAQATSAFEGLAAVEPFSVDRTGGERPEVVYAMRVTDRFFDLLRVQPAQGRLFGLADFVPGAAVAVVSHEFWEQLGDGPPPGRRAVTLDGGPYTIIGVLPKRADLNLFHGRDRRDVFLPKVFQEYEPGIRGAGWWAAIGRLKPGVDHAAAQAELDVISARIAAANPQTNARTVARIEPLQTSLMRTVRPALLMMLAAAVLVLLVACANVANLLLVRGVERTGEFGVRTALGASRARLVRQLLTEGWFLAVAGSLSGIGVAWLTIRAAVLLAPVESRRLSELSVDSSVLLFVLASGMIAALVFSAVPAWHLSRRTRDLGSAFRSTTGRPARRFRDALVAAEIAVAVVLAVVVGLLGRSFAQVLSVDPGFRSDRLAVVQVFAWDRHGTPARLAAFFDNAFRELRSVPGVARVGAVSAMPFIEANINMESVLAIEGRPPAASGEAPTAFLTVATPEYFRVMNIPVAAGRLFGADDRAGSAPVALVSQSLARRHWPHGTAVGSIVTVDLRGRPVRAEIIGVVGAVRHDGLELPPRDELFLTLSQQPSGSMTFVLEATGDPRAVLEPAKAAIWKVDPLQTIYDAGTVPELLSSSTAPRRFALVLTGVYAGAALGLAALGVYAVLAAATRQRTREIGVRLALGAPPPLIRREVLAQAARLGAVGLVAGLLCSAGVVQLMRGQLFATEPFDPVTVILVGGVVMAATIAAAYAPARRAMRIDPVMALRD